MFTVALSIIVKNWGEETSLHQQVSLFIVAYPHKEWTIDTHCYMHESQNKYAERKKPYKRVHTVWFHVSKILKSANQTVLTESRTVVAWDGGVVRSKKKGWRRGRRTLLGVMSRLLLLIIVIVSRVCTYAPNLSSLPFSLNLHSRILLFLHLFCNYNCFWMHCL